MENEEYSSDTDDDDYNPSGAEESDDQQHFDSEESNSDAETEEGLSKKHNTSRKRKRNTSDNHKTETDDSELNTEEKIEKNPEETKRRKEALWSDFLKDTNTTLKNKPKTNDTSQLKIESNGSSQTKTSKIYNFAGEEVKIKEIGATVEKVKPESDAKPRSSIPISIPSVKKSGGLGSILGKISNKGTKLSTLEKSKLDWSEYKAEEGIEEEVSSHNKGKDGYLDRQAFLQRTDFRQFEIEKQLRISKRK